MKKLDKTPVVEKTPIVLAPNTCELNDSPLHEKTENVLEAINKAIENRNKTFSEMTRLEKRIEIAKDVIASVHSKKYVAEQNTYLSLSSRTESCIDYTLDNIKQPHVICNVCAIGSMFVSDVLKTDKLKKSFGFHHSSMVKTLSNIYSERELRILEMCFEGNDVHDMFVEENETQLRKDARNFRGQFNTPRKRLLGIMENIVKNNGHFIYKSIKI